MVLEGDLEEDLVDLEEGDLEGDFEEEDLEEDFELDLDFDCCLEMFCCVSFEYLVFLFDVVVVIVVDGVCLFDLIEFASSSASILNIKKNKVKNEQLFSYYYNEFIPMLLFILLNTSLEKVSTK